eukprot:COSAG05_NODE_869_length_6866_cov_20.524457_6_plen_104_part_00
MDEDPAQLVGPRPAAVRGEEKRRLSALRLQNLEARLASVLPPRASDSASELMQSYCGVEALEHASRTPYHITRVWPKCGESLGPISWWLGGVVTCIRYDVELP